MSIPLKLPSLGESVIEGVVARWLVAEGDLVELDQSVCEVTTDKIDAEIPAPAAGRIERILVAEGETVSVGAELATIDQNDVASSPVPSRAPAHASPAAAPDAQAQTEPTRSRPLPSAFDPDIPSVQAESPRATPVARRVADGASVDLSDVRGTGTAGRITKTDVLGHAAASGERVTAVATPALPPLEIELEQGDRVVPMSAQRKLIAAHMVYSKRTSPHVGTVAEVDLAQVSQMRERENDRFRDRHGSSLTLLPFVAQSTIRALREFPALNASVADDAIVERGNVHLSIAVETAKGLLAPVVRNADRLSLTGLALSIADLSARAQQRRLGPDELRGGTFTLSNPGRRGNLYGFAIINQPQVGILRLGEVIKRAVVRTVDGQDAIVVRPMMHIALSYDHRAVDGSRANAFLYRIRELLEVGEFEL